jgi:hypothetical protein
VLEAPADTAADSIIEAAEDCGATAVGVAAGADAPACAAAALSTAAEPEGAAEPGPAAEPDAAAPMAVGPAGDESETGGGGGVAAAGSGGGVAAAGGGRLPVGGNGAPPFAAGVVWGAPLLRPVLFATWRSVPAKSVARCAAVPESAAPAPAGACGFEGAAWVAGAAGALKFGIVTFMP